MGAHHSKALMEKQNEFSHDYGANRLLAAKRARKRAEGDYQLLQNRLVRLRLEEEKAKKKISETKKRAQEILALKARNEMVSRLKRISPLRRPSILLHHPAASGSGCPTA